MIKKLLVIILHYGDVKLTQKCVNSVTRAKIPNDCILVVDNNSNFTSPKAIQKIKIIRNKSNVGCAAGMNIGIKHFLSQGGSHFLLLNNDVTIETMDVYKLQNFLTNHKDIGIVGSSVAFFKKGKLIYDIGGRLNKWFGRTSHNEVDFITDEMPYSVDYISGCCMLIKREVFDIVGLLDEQFFLYYEDVDFCLRAKKAGFKTYVYPAITVNHDLSSSVGKNSGLAVYHQTLSAVLFGKKYFYGIKRILNMLFISAQSLYIFLKHPVVGRFAFLGLFYGLYRRSD